jgi:hypothetical protein
LGLLINHIITLDPATIKKSLTNRHWCLTSIILLSTFTKIYQLQSRENNTRTTFDALQDCFGNQKSSRP